MDEKMLKMLNYPKEDCECITCQRARRIKELEDVQEFTTKNIFFLQEELDKARTRIKELEEGIMDTSKIYVKMCEGAFKDIGFIDQPYKTFSSRLRNLYCCRNEFNKGEFAFLAQAEAPTNNWWQIYFQDQLQEMVTPDRCTPDYMLERFYDWYNDIKTKRYKHTVYGIKSFEQLWLAFVMKEKFNKVWDGEEWKGVVLWSHC